MKRVAWILTGAAGVLALAVILADLSGLAAYALHGTAAALLVASVMMHYLGRYEAKRRALMRRLMEQGIDARVTLDEIGGSTGRINGNPQLKLRLTVRIKGKKPYQIESVFGVHRDKAPGLQQGKVYRGKVNPDNPQNLLVPDWVELA